MGFDEDELLVRELGELGGLMGPPGRRGAERGARGAAKEGLIKQRAGTKAARRVAAAMAPEADDPPASYTPS